MRSKILLASGLVVAFVLGLMANGIYSNSTRAFNPVEDQQTQTQAPVVARTHFVQPTRTVYTPVSYASNSASPSTRARKTRSLEKEALIIGGSAGAGAAIGAIAGGGKGAGIGALSGGVAGLVYDLATRHK